MILEKWCLLPETVQMVNVYDLSNSECCPRNAKANLLPRTDKLRIEAAADAGPFACPVAIVETEEKEEASLSAPPPVIPLKRFDAVELCLFFLGSVGKTLPGNSVRNFLCNLTKSPYRRPTKNGSSPFFLTRRINSYKKKGQRHCSSLCLN